MMKHLKVKNIYRNNGITLVALVITIIILLILAGIAIASLTGDNGLFARARQAREETEISQEKEQINLALINTRFNTSEYGNTDSITAVDLNNEFEISEIDAVAVDENQRVKITFGNGRRYIVKHTGEIIGPISQTVITLKDNASIYYGQDIIYSGYESTYNGGWQLFYVDDETNEIFIISKNAVKNESLNKSGYSDSIIGGSAFVSTTKYGAKWNKMWLDKCETVNISNNAQGVAYLCDSTQWSDYAIQNTYAVGGPTLELLVASWNDSHNINNQITLNKNDVTSTGYPIPKGLENEDSIPTNTLYRPTSSGMWWIASPSLNHRNHVSYIDYYNGYVKYSYYDDDRFSVRVLVCIPATKVQITNESLIVTE